MSNRDGLVDVSCSKKGIVTNLGFATGTVTSEDGRTFVIYGGSFAGGQQKTLAVGDVVTFEPGGKGETFVTSLKLTPTANGRTSCSIAKECRSTSGGNTSGTRHLGGGAASFRGRRLNNGVRHSP